MIQPETRFKNNFRKQLDTIPSSWFVKVSLRSILGIPDLLGVVAGRFVAIELKRNCKEKPSKMQEYHLQFIHSCGGLAFRAHPDNADDIIKELKRL